MSRHVSVVASSRLRFQGTNEVKRGRLGIRQEQTHSLQSAFWVGTGDLLEEREGLSVPVPGLPAPMTCPVTKFVAANRVGVDFVPRAYASAP